MGTLNPAVVPVIRKRCLRIRELLSERLTMQLPTPPQAVRTNWFTSWETTDVPRVFGTPWSSFGRQQDGVPEVTPPLPL